MSSIWERAQKVMPGGVNSPVRSFAKVGMEPIFVESAHGAYLTDERGQKYLDYICSWGPLIFGHSYEPVIEKVAECLRKGTSFGLATALEVEFAELLTRAVPSLEMVRLVNSGTEATMSAIRLARGFTRREKIIKFAGCYHGHSNELLVATGSGALTFGSPESAGVTSHAVQDTLVLPYNDRKAVEKVFAEYGEDIAAIIVEPIAANMGLVSPQEGFLAGLRRVTKEYKALLIFDEVITGFRVAYGGAQELYGVIPDLTCLGKIIGGGFPIGAYGGRKEIMEMISPLGPVYQAGTLSGNPVAVTAGMETIRLLKQGHVYDQLQSKGDYLRNGLRQIAKSKGVKLQITGVGSLTGVFFSEEIVDCYEKVLKASKELYQNFFRANLKKGILLPPSPYETIFISTAHTQEDLDGTLEVWNGVLNTWK
ncbi:MAG TPA: glutamate-1-semialdehyde-2,1-aminomutase [Firmicutes bacterium]|jgi:glutamate-1-semialdehyde 2,1-aminomutase|nr:glutamate-1-semialdehyde-2,1-aminomutase [Bacillota bacterium]